MSSNHVRTVRTRAKRQGLALTVRGDLATLCDPEGNQVHTGTMDDVDHWLKVRDVYRPSGPSPMPLPEDWVPWVGLFVAEQNAAKRRPGTIGTRLGHLATFARSVGRGPLAVTRDDLIRYLGQNDWKPRTAHTVRSSLRVFFRFLVNMGYRADNPAGMLPDVRIPRSLPRPCPDHVIQAAYESIADSRLRLALRIAVETGLRRIEVVAVRTSDVQGRCGEYVLHVVGKGGHERVVPITDDLAAAILRVPTTWVFPNRRDGGPITAQWLGDQIADALPGHWTLHTLRHRYASLAYQQSNDLRAVQELLGHSSPVTTAIYTKVSDGAMRSAASAALIPFDGP